MTHRQARHLKKAFLESFAETGNVSESCRVVGIARGDVYRWQEHDDQFAAGWRDAEIQATELLETEARRRAVNGVTTETPIIHRGETVASVVETKYSDTLLIFLLKARNPAKYRENKFEHQHRGLGESKREGEFAYDDFAAAFSGLLSSGGVPTALEAEGSGESVDSSYSD